jgi:hypothetical protein
MIAKFKFLYFARILFLNFITMLLRIKSLLRSDLMGNIVRYASAMINMSAMSIPYINGSKHGK